MTRIAIIVGSTRPGRHAGSVARWVYGIAAERDDATFEILDLAEHDLPHLDEPVPAAMGSDYQHPHTQAWAAKVAAFDGYIFVTPEYNHSTTGVLKNAIDYLYVEWQNKAAGFVSYGTNGGVRATEHLRQIMGELQVADVKAGVALSLFTDFADGGDVAAVEHHQQALDRMLDQVIGWSEALKPLRTAPVLSS